MMPHKFKLSAIINLGVAASIIIAKIPELARGHRQLAKSKLVL